MVGRKKKKKGKSKATILNLIWHQFLSKSEESTVMYIALHTVTKVFTALWYFSQE